MKNLYALAAFTFLVTGGGFKQVSAQELTYICSQGFHTSSVWKVECLFHVWDWPDILGVTDIRIDQESTGTWYNNGSYGGTMTPAFVSDEAPIVRRDDGGEIVMNAMVITTHTAVKALAGDPITWNLLCADGYFFAKSIGVWYELYDFQDSYCGFFSAE